MDVLSIQEMIAREEAAFRDGITAVALMEAAGQAMGRRVLEIYPRAKNFLILVGKGNNGGDGIVVARDLLRSGKTVKLVLAVPEELLGELPGAQLKKSREEFPQLSVEVWKDDLRFPHSDGVAIDGLLGVQARGPLRGNLAKIVAATNAARAAQFFRTVALDLPTGLAAFEDGGKPEQRDGAMVADVTLAVGFAKKVLVREALSPWVGRIEVMPLSRQAGTSTPQQVLVPAELAGLLPRRSAFSFKNDYGKIAIIAGSRGFTGAPVLCAQAAQSIGAGLLSIIAHPDVADLVAAQAPAEAMVTGWTFGGEVPEVVTEASALVIGPGLGTSKASTEMLRAALGVGCPVLVDADGLNLLAKELTLLKKTKGPVVLTPHVGEMARLIGRKFLPDERETVARNFVDEYQVTLVLKGTRTLVTAPGQPLFINTTGNPGLSTGGSGDTLSGIIGGLLAQGLAPWDAARLGVWLHGHAADLVLLNRESEEGLTPTMLSSKLGAALASLRAHAAPSHGLIEMARV